jgi:hypothetical protein
MTFSDLVKHATTLGYKSNQQENRHKLTFESNGSIKIEVLFPNDNMEGFLDDSVNIDWEYYIVNEINGEKTHSEWFDYYQGTTEKKLGDMKQDILEYINNFANQKFNIVEKSVFSLFGKKFLKYKELVFE